MHSVLLTGTAVALLVASAVHLSGSPLLARDARLRSEFAALQRASDATATVLVLDVPAGGLRAAAARAAADVLGHPAAQANVMALVDIHDGLAVVEDFSAPARAHEGVQRWLRGDAWTYRHIDMRPSSPGPVKRSRAFDALRSVIVDVASLSPARIVLFTAVQEEPGNGPAYTAIAELARRHRVQVHVVVVSVLGADTTDDRLLGAEITRTRQAMVDCDPRRVACGDVEQVGQEERRDRDAAAARVRRGLSRLATDTGGMLVKAPTASDAFTQALASPPPPRSNAAPRDVPREQAWRAREDQAWANTAAAAISAPASDVLQVVRVPSADGMRPIVVVSPTTPTTPGPWAAFVRVRDTSGKTIAAWSRFGHGGVADPLIFLAPSTGQGAVLDLVIEGERRKVTRQHAMPSCELAEAVGDVFLVERVEHLDGAQGVDPFVADGRRYVPLTGSSVRRSTAAHLTAAIATRDAAPRLVVELWRAGERPRRTSIDTRSVQRVTRFDAIALPMQDLADGSYELRVSGEHEGRAWTRALTFTIGP